MELRVQATMSFHVFSRLLVIYINYSRHVWFHFRLTDKNFADVRHSSRSSIGHIVLFQFITKMFLKPFSG